MKLFDSLAFEELFAKVSFLDPKLLAPNVKALLEAKSDVTVVVVFFFYFSSIFFHIFLFSFSIFSSSAFPVGIFSPYLSFSSMFIFEVVL